MSTGWIRQSSVVLLPRSTLWSMILDHLVVSRSRAKKNCGAFGWAIGASVTKIDDSSQEVTIIRVGHRSEFYD